MTKYIRKNLKKQKKTFATPLNESNQIELQVSCLF